MRERYGPVATDFACTEEVKEEAPGVAHAIFKMFPKLSSSVCSYA
jgi:hypothetical protein